jgi:hypothetical protein
MLDQRGFLWIKKKKNLIKLNKKIRDAFDAVPLDFLRNTV